MDIAVFCGSFEIFLNYQQHKVGIYDNHIFPFVCLSSSYFFPFVSFVTIIIVTHTFGEKMLNIMY